MAAKRFLALLLMDPRGAERQQKQISNYKDNWKNPNPTTTKQPTQPSNPSMLISGSFSRTKQFPSLPEPCIHWRAQKWDTVFSPLHFMLSWTVPFPTYLAIFCSLLSYSSTKSASITCSWTLLSSQTSVLMYHHSKLLIQLQANLRSLSIEDFLTPNSSNYEVRMIQILLAFLSRL